MHAAVVEFVELVRRSHLLAPPELQVLWTRWGHQAGADKDDLDQFIAWLVEQHHLTEYQVQRLQHRKTEHFFFNQYKILERIGQGSVAKVYRAVDAQGAEVALKVLPPSRARDPRFLEQVQQGTRAAAQLHHPNVVATLAMDQAEGLHFVVMEHLDGETLAEVLSRRGHLPVIEATRLLYQAFLGLQHIYERGQVHGNLEPANLMLTPRRQENGPDTTMCATLKILDIGLGRAFLESATRDAGQDLVAKGRSNFLAATEDLAPEQVRHPQSWDIRADIYSLGCILYHCLVGQAPFADSNPAHQALRHVTETPRLLRQLDPNLPVELQNLVQRLLAKDPAERFPTPEQAAQALVPFFGQDLPKVLIARPVDSAIASKVDLAGGDFRAFTEPNPDDPMDAADLPTIAVSRGGDALATRDLRKNGRWRALALALMVGAIPLAFIYLVWQGYFSSFGDSKGQQSRGPAPVIPMDPGKGKDKELAESKDSQQKSDPMEKPPEKKSPPANPDPEPKQDPDKEKTKPISPATPSPDKPAPVLPVPDREDQDKAEVMIRALYKTDYSKKKPADQKALAARLFLQGLETKDDQVARFVLFRETRDLAGQTGEVKLAWQAVEQLSKEYMLDSLQLKIEVLAQAMPTATNPSSKNFLDLLFQVLDEAIASDRYDLGRLVVTQAQALAKRFPSAALGKRIDPRVKELEEMQQAFENLQAEAPLVWQAWRQGSSPRDLDPEKCEKLGYFLCLVKGDWAAGLAYLTRTPEAELQLLARYDLAMPKDPTDQVKLGDQWGERAARETGLHRKNMQRRMAYWYQLALPGLSGLTKVRVEKTLRAKGL